MKYLIVLFIPVSFYLFWQNRMINKNKEIRDKDLNTMLVWYQMEPNESRFLETFPFLKENSEFTKRTKSLLDTVAKKNLGGGLMENNIIPNIYQTRGLDSIFFKKETYYPKKVWVLKNGSPVKASDPLLQINNKVGKAFNSVLFHINKYDHLIDDNHKTINHLNKLLLVNNENAPSVKVILIYFACIVPIKNDSLSFIKKSPVFDSVQLMMRYPAYNLDKNKLTNYRFQKRPWWQYVTGEYKPIGDINLTKPYLDIRKDIPPVRTYYLTDKKTVPGLIFVLCVDLIIEPSPPN